jgi:DNA-binding MarR family transcriptional regulator
MDRVDDGGAPAQEADAAALAAEFARAAEFRRALRRFLARTREATSASRLTPERYDVLLNVKASPGEQLSVGDLADILLLAPSTATELVQRCEEAGLVYRRPAAGDARVSYISLTEEGESRLMKTFLALRADREALADAFRAVDRQFRAIVRSYAGASE